jgi:peptide/nickel transport system substrate-binding protein
VMPRLLIAFVLAACVQAAGNRAVLSQRAEPRTFNPVIAVDSPTRDILRLLHGRLARINGTTLGVDPALAKGWKFSPDGRVCTIELRQGIRFSDGDPFDADDVLFSFEVYLDAKTGSPQRDLLAPEGQPIRVSKTGPFAVRIEFPVPHAPGARLFDGLAMLPKHLLEKAYREGKLAQSWTVSSPLNQMAGLGPFVAERYVPGQRLVLKRNPNYWQPGKPGLDEVEILFTPDQTAEALRFRHGEIDLLQRPSAKAFAAFEANVAKLDLGPSLEYHFLFFNLNTDKVGEAVRAKQIWFRDIAFRKAVSLASDRAAMAKLAFEGRASALAHHVTPGNRAWLVDTAAPRHSVEEAKRILRDARFKLQGDALISAAGQPVEFSLLVNSANAAQMQIATILQEDLKSIGIKLRITPMEFRSLVDRVTRSLDFEAAIMGLGSGDADPNSEMNIWMSSGSMHVWNLSAEKNPMPWEREIDQWMQRQRSTLNVAERKRAYGNVQKLVAEHLPLIALVSPHLLVVHKPGLQGVRPGIVPPYALWNIEEWRWGASR